MKTLYHKPYLVIFGAAVALSAHGLYTAATTLGRIVPWLAWAYVLIVDMLAVAAYRTWRTATETGTSHWACGVAAGAAAFTVALNVLGVFPELAAPGIGPLIAGFPPIAALLATALRMAERRLAGEAVKELDGNTSTAEVESSATVEPVAPRSAQPERPRLTAVPTNPDTAVAAIVRRHVTAGGHVNDSELTALVASKLGVSDRTARRRLAPFREGVAA